MALKTKLTEILPAAAPLMVAPMCGMVKGLLAGEVARAGGVGVIGIGGAGIFGPEFVKKEFEIAKTTANGSGALGFGFLALFLQEEDASLTAAIECKPDLLFVAFGSAEVVVTKSKAAGIPVAIQVQTMAQARTAHTLGADIIVLQGCDAGGHGIQHNAVSVMTLVPQARQEFGENACIVAAGGIGDGAGIAASLILGADGVLLGTRYLATKECGAKDDYKARILKTTDGTEATIVSQAFDWLTSPNVAFPDPWSGRALKDSTTIEKFHVPVGTPVEHRPPVSDDDRLWYKQGGYDRRAIWCGAAVGLHSNDDQESAFDVTQALINDAVDRLRHPRRVTLL